MEKYTHITFGASAAGNLRRFLESNETNFSGEVVNLSDDFSVGPLFDVGNEEQFDKRVDYISNIYNTVYSDEIKTQNDKTMYKEEMVKSHLILSSIPNENTIIVWHGSNSNDWIGFSYVLNVYEDRDIYAINVSELENYGPIISLGQMSEDMIGESAQLFAKLSDNEKTGIAGIWENFTKDKNAFRVLDEHGLSEVPEYYFDEMILEEISDDFSNAAKVVGSVLGKYEGYLGDMIIGYRILELIKNGKLEYQGDLGAIRLYDVKKK
jgi:hypothetical protein